MANIQDVDIPTYDGLKLKGTFYSVGAKEPCIILSSGFSGSRDHFLPDFAARFNAAGYGALAYDNRCWGDSEGLPRDEVDPVLQTRDYLDAFNYAAAHPDVDPAKIVYWGSSMSGGNAICAAVMNRSIAGLIVQVPFVSGEAISRLPGPPADLLISNRHPESEARVPVFPSSVEEVLNGTCKAVLKDPGVIPFIAETTRRGMRHAESCTLQSLTNIVLHEPTAYIHRISPTPFLMTVGDQDVTIPTHLQLEAFEKALQPKTLKIVKGAGHFEPYYGQSFEENIAAQLEFLKGIL
ncbi:related to hydrolases of the alpha/beta superfamily [Fusarium oxysporum]|uniref:Related to hydrolases of the alpha/beta superfamily n=1 Tax=Fusarium oxysporum TaxID=5507 RepID=A0A2H3TVP6_FUSOX|nr:related to hydrolases of the alpha/beta superfamily [Fusarium oxysporum]